MSSLSPLGSWYHVAILTCREKVQRAETTKQSASYRQKITISFSVLSSDLCRRPRSIHKFKSNARIPATCCRCRRHHLIFDYNLSINLFQYSSATSPVLLQTNTQTHTMRCLKCVGAQRPRAVWYRWTHQASIAFSVLCANRCILQKKRVARRQR